MKQKKIELGRPVDAERVLGVAKSVLEGQNYLWERTGPSSANAYQGGKKIEKKSSSKLALGLELAGDGLVLSQETNGAVGYFVNIGPFAAYGVDYKFKKVSKEIDSALQQASLVA